MHRTLIAAILHETHTFNPLPTVLSDFSVITDERVPQVFEGINTETSGFLACARRYGWEVVTPVVAKATSGGRTPKSTFEHIVGLLINGIRAAGHLDGVAIALHGAMATEEYDDADGEILRRVREAVGPDVPIALTLDLHGNISPLMAECADIICAYRTNPHVDHSETAQRAGKLLDHAMNGEIRPRTVIARCPALYAFDRGRTHTGHGPMIEALQKAQALEARDAGVLSIGLFAGFSHADTEFTGPSVTLTGDGNDPRYQRIADEFMSFGWENRARETVVLVDPADAVKAVLRDGSPDGPPIVIGDYTDSPGGGTPGEATNVLRAMLEAGLTNAALAAINDPEAVAAGFAAGEGATIRVSLGGKSVPQYGGGPLDVTGKVIKLADGDYVHDGPYNTGRRDSFGNTMILRVGDGIDVVVSSRNKNIVDLQQFKTFGIDPTKRTAVAVKCMHGFRGAFEPIAKEVIVVDAGGLTSYQYSRFDYRKLQRPIWPLDANVQMA